MTITKLKQGLRRRRELREWLKRQRRNRIRPATISDHLQRDLNIQVPEYQESSPLPRRDKSRARRLAPVFALQRGGL